MRRPRERFDGALVGFFESLGEQLSGEADRTKSDGKCAGERSRTEDGDEQQRPYQGVDRSRGYEHEFGEQIERKIWRHVARRQQADGHRHDDRYDRSQRRNM